MSSLLPTEVDLDYMPYSILDEPGATEAALKRLTDWDFDDGDSSFAEEAELFPIKEFKSLGSNIFEGGFHGQRPVVDNPFAHLKANTLGHSSQRNEFTFPANLELSEPSTSDNGSASSTSASPLHGSLERPTRRLPETGYLSPPPVMPLPFTNTLETLERLRRKNQPSNHNFEHSQENLAKVKSASSHKPLTSFLTSTPRKDNAGVSSFNPGAHRDAAFHHPSGAGTPTGSLRRKPKHLVWDVDPLGMSPGRYPAFRPHPNTVARVSFPATTWDTMMRSFCIALQTNSVFMCDRFLGGALAGGLTGELEYMKACGVFERQQFRAEGAQERPYASVFLTEEEEVHRRVDGLALMVQKLARYYSSAWRRVSVQLCHYPAGQPAVQGRANTTLTRGRLLKCVYFPNRQTGLHPDEGLLRVRTNTTTFRLEPVYDRLVAFWADALENEVTRSTTESYLVNVWMVG